MVENIQTKYLNTENWPGGVWHQHSHYWMYSSSPRHALASIAAHILTEGLDGETPLVPSSLMEYSTEQSRSIDLQKTLQLLATGSQTVTASPDTYTHTDRIIRWVDLGWCDTCVDDDLMGKHALSGMDRFNMSIHMLTESSGEWVLDGITPLLVIAGSRWACTVCFEWMWGVYIDTDRIISWVSLGWYSTWW